MEISRQAKFLVAWVLVLNFGINLIVISMNGGMVELDLNPGLYVSLIIGIGALLTTAGSLCPAIKWALQRRFVIALAFVAGIYELVHAATGKGLTLLSISFILLSVAAILRNKHNG